MSDENMQATDEGVAGIQNAGTFSRADMDQRLTQSLTYMHDIMCREMQEALRQHEQIMLERMTENSASIRGIAERMQRIERRVEMIENVIPPTVWQGVVVDAEQEQLHSLENDMRNLDVTRVSASPTVCTSPSSDHAQWVQGLAGQVLLEAIQENRQEYVCRLLDAGVNVNYSLTNSLTPLMSTAYYNRVDIAKLLLERGADINFRNRLGNTALHYAICENHEGACVYVFIDAGSDVNARANDGSTPLHNAARCNRPGIVRQLLAAGANRTAEDNFGRTPLQLALSDPVRELLVDQQDC